MAIVSENNALNAASRAHPRAIAILLFILLAAASAEARLVIEPNVGFDRQYKSGYWAPVVVRMSNQGEADFNGRVEAVVIEGTNRVEHVFSKPVILPAPRSVKEVHLAVYFPAGVRPDVLIRLREGRRLLKEHEYNMNPVNRAPEERLILLVDNELNALKFLNNHEMENKDKLAFINVQPWMLPEMSTAYESLHGVCLGDIDPLEISLGAQSALRDYVRSGGNLIVFTGQSGQRFRGTWVEDLLPVSLGETQVIQSLNQLTTARAGFKTLAPGIVISLSASKENPEGPYSVIRQDGIPMIAKGRIGNGNVTFAAFDPDDQPFQDPENRTAVNALMLSLVERFTLIPRVLDPGAKSQSSGFAFINAWTDEDQKLDQQIRDHPSMRIPDFTFIGGFLVLYVIVLGPVNYFMLKKRKRLELAWITVPLIVLVFSAGAYTVGKMTKGNDELIHGITFCRGSTGVPGLFYETYFGLFSPSKTSYDLKVQNGEALFREYRAPGSFGEAMDVRFDEGVEMRDYGMNMWTMDNFAAEGLWDPDGKHGLLESDLILDGTMVKGEIHNNLDLHLKSCVILAGDSAILRVGDLAPGQKYSVKGIPLRKTDSAVKFGDILRTSLGREHERKLAERAIEFISEKPDYSRPGGIVLWGWLEPDRHAIPEISIGRGCPREGAILVQYRLPVDYTSGTIPFGIMRPRLVKSVGDYRPLNENYVLANANLYFDIDIPGEIEPSRIQILKIFFSIRDQYNIGYSASIFDWQTQGFHALVTEQTGTQPWERAFGPEANRYIRPVDPVVRICVTQGNPDPQNQRGNPMFQPNYYGPYGGYDNSSLVGGQQGVVLSKLDIEVEMKP